LLKETTSAFDDNDYNDTKEDDDDGNDNYNGYINDTWEVYNHLRTTVDYISQWLRPELMRGRVDENEHEAGDED